MIQLKPEVRIKSLSRGLILILYGLFKFTRSYSDICPSEIVITSINDSTHSANSRHYRDEAIDIRSKNFSTTNKEKFREYFETYLNTLCRNCTFTVLLENLGTSNEHFHVQVKKGSKCI